MEDKAQQSAQAILANTEIQDNPSAQASVLAITGWSNWQVLGLEFLMFLNLQDFAITESL